MTLPECRDAAYALALVQDIMQQMTSRMTALIATSLLLEACPLRGRPELQSKVEVSANSPLLQYITLHGKVHQSRPCPLDTVVLTATSVTLQ